MKLELEKFKIIPTTYNAIDFMKIQYEDKDLVMKLKGEFFITDAKNYGLRLVFTPDDIYVIHQPGGPYWEKLCPTSWIPPEAVGRGQYPRQRAQFFPIRTDLVLVNNIFIFF